MISYFFKLEKLRLEINLIILQLCLNNVKSPEALIPY